MVENFNVSPAEIAPLGGNQLDGSRLATVTVTKATQNDTVTLNNIKTLLAVVGGSVTASNGAITAETYTAVLSTGVITLTSSAVGSTTLLLLVR
jgi:redox-sensitive bicupin YhaK (pirin superfamily)